MSLNLSSHKSSYGQRPSWSGSAFIVEALLLLVLLMASFAIFTQLFALSAEQSTESDKLSQAVSTASTVAERFSANPTSVETTELVNDLVVQCDTSSEARDSGVLYKATISVYERDNASTSEIAPKGDALYTITTARYLSGVNR